VRVDELTPTLALGALEIDLGSARASFRGRDLGLSRPELELLTLLVANRHRVVARAELASALGIARGRSVDVLLTRLRRSIEPDFVRNVRSRGWIVVPRVLEV
jgi:two-component system OmpR family response regulator